MQEKARIKRFKTKTHVTICNSIMKEKQISLKAKGLYSLVMSLPDTWDFSVAGICTIIKEESSTVYTALRELIGAGYCDRQMVIENGRFTNCEYSFFENKKKKQVEEKPHEEKPHAVNDEDNNNNSSNNNIPTIKENKEENKIKKLSNDNKKDDVFEKFWSDYGKTGSKARALKEWNKLKKKDKELVEKNLSDYLIYCKRSKRSKKDACSYLHQEYYKQQWNQTPECYQEQPTDNERQIRFKNYMVSRFADLIYHRNPLTFEQATQLLEELGTEEFEKAMDKLSQQDIHQYYSINEGVRKVLENENQEE